MYLPKLKGFRLYLIGISYYLIFFTLADLFTIKSVHSHHYIPPYLIRSVSIEGNTIGDIKCTDQPEIAIKIIAAGRRLGVTLVRGKPLLAGKDATYKAHYGRLGTVMLSDRFMSPVVRCKLISHEFIHVLQHLNADLKGVEPLGWELPLDSFTRFKSLQEAEAYTYQNRASDILKLLMGVLQKYENKRL